MIKDCGKRQGEDKAFHLAEWRNCTGFLAKRTSPPWKSGSPLQVPLTGNLSPYLQHKYLALLYEMSTSSFNIHNLFFTLSRNKNIVLEQNGCNAVLELPSAGLAACIWNSSGIQILQIVQVSMKSQAISLGADISCPKSAISSSRMCPVREKAQTWIASSETLRNRKWKTELESKWAEASQCTVKHRSGFQSDDSWK